jgi:hypothetical protein
MIKKTITNLFKKKSNERSFIIATLNEKIMPVDRGEIYEDVLDEFLNESTIGEVTGGGTMQYVSGEIEFVDIEINLFENQINKEVIDKIIKKLESIGAPKGSKLKIEKTGEIINFGKLEGIGIYLDGLNLSKKVYEESDVNFVISEVHRLTNIEFEINRYWENDNGTALYFYGRSFDEMKEQIQEFIENYPLCENCEIKQIA